MSPEIASDASPYQVRPWLANYEAGQPADITAEYTSLLEAFAAQVEHHPTRVAIRYFDHDITFAELDQRSIAVASALRDRGFGVGDRLALYTQNDPAFVYGLLAAWKLGGIAVAVNPMNKSRELRYLLADSGAVALLCLDELYRDVAADVLASRDLAVHTVVTYSGFDDQTRDDSRVLASQRLTIPEGTLDLRSLVADGSGLTLPAAPQPDDESVAIITYTSGTTGEPKGAMNTHSGMAFNAQTFRDWCHLTADDVILGVAPLFHITGLIAHVAVMLHAGSTLLLSHRFDRGVILDAIRQDKPTFTIGAITVFINLSAAPDHSADDWSCFRVIMSGGAAIPAAVTEDFWSKTGQYIHSAYGLTETTSPSHLVPIGVRAPVDPRSGALSVGLPVFNTVARVLDEDDHEVSAGQIGEIAIAGPQVVPGYWGKPRETAESIPGGELRTGDVGFMDENGWFYIVDRKKDMINASGYKVWPREVEDVLYGHPAVSECAVVGVSDSYRGETVKAFVTLKDSSAASEAELIEFCKARMAAYKYPRSVELVNTLPKTVSGKILRKDLRT